MPESHRVQASFKVSPDTKNSVDLLASALDMEKSRVIEAAVERYLGEKRELVRQHLERSRDVVDRAASMRARR